MVDIHANGKHTVFAKKAGIPHGTFSAYIKGRVPHVEHLCRIRDTYSINLNWLLMGDGDKYIKERESELDEDPVIAELLEGAKKVLKSGNKVAFDALDRNIRYFSLAVETEKRLQTLETRMAEFEKELTVRGDKVVCGESKKSAAT